MTESGRQPSRRTRRRPAGIEDLIAEGIKHPPNERLIKAIEDMRAASDSAWSTADVMSSAERFASIQRQLEATRQVADAILNPREPTGSSVVPASPDLSAVTGLHGGIDRVAAILEATAVQISAIAQTGELARQSSEKSDRVLRRLTWVLAGETAALIVLTIVLVVRAFQGH